MALATNHRPATFREIAGQPTDKVESLINGRDTPNFLFWGPPGTGKTSTARAISYELHGDPNAIYELNASDDRGIDAVRNKIHEVADQYTLTGNPQVILLDEADAMTTDAQQALRAPMEQSPAVFILTANDVDPIHRAIRSRCHDFKYGPVPVDAIVTRLEEVANLEDANVDRARLETLAKRSDGDMRAALNHLEQELRFTGHKVEKKAEKVAEYLD